MSNGLIVTLDKDIPTILNCGDEVIEIVWHKNTNGKPMVQIKASKEVGITGAHLLQKAYFERDKLRKDLEEVQTQYDFLIDQRRKQKEFHEQD